MPEPIGNRVSTNPFRDGIHLWMADLDTLSPSQLLPHLDSTEQQRAERYQLPQVRSRFIASRGQLRELLAHCIGIPPAQLEIAYTKQGKPILPDYPGWHFNVSHSCNLAVWAIAYGQEIGIDLEQIRPDIPLQNLILRALSSREQHILANHQGDPISLFLQFWTRKEAFLKATGCPNFAQLPHIDTSDNPIALYNPESEAWQTVDNWHSQSLATFPNCIASIVAKGQNWTLHHHEI